MKVILLADVARVGKKYDIKDVPQGFAQNFLLKNGKAVIATPEKIKEVEARKEAIYLSHTVERAKLKAGLDALKEISIVIVSPANEKGHLFKGIHAKDIVSELKKCANVAVAEDMIQLPEPIKEIGKHIISVAWENEKGSFTLEVKAK